jgi:ribosomal-protein-alanine N-acetyltransferase
VKEAEALAALHAAAFSGADRPWSAEAIADLLRAPEVFLARVAEGFALGRAVADEAEVLTLAVAPRAQRRGFGVALVERLAAEAARRGAARLFLEVADDNAAARALYARSGFAEVGRRRGYYAPGRDAVILALELAGRTSVA